MMGRQGGVLSGLRGNANLSALGGGLRTASDADLGMKRSMGDHQRAMTGLQQQSQLRQQANQTNASRAQGDSRLRGQQADMSTRLGSMRMQDRYNRAQLSKESDMRMRQAAFNYLADDF